MNDLSGTPLVLHRRAFLAGSGALVVGLATPDVWAQAQSAAPSPASPNNPALLATRLDSYLAINPDGSVEVFFGAIDGGQGLEISIAQMVAEELDVPFETISMVMGDSARTLNMGGASGATSVSRRGTALMKAAAAAKRLLIAAAAKRLGVPSGTLIAADGVLTVVGDPSRKVSYAELIGGREFGADIGWNGQWGNGHDLSTDAPLKKPSDYAVIGQSFRRKDLPKKVFGLMNFPGDLKLPGMLHARMVRPPVAGAVPVSVDAASIQDIPGAEVVHVKDLLAVVAPKEWNAVRAMRALKVTWSDSKPDFPGYERVHDHIRKAAVVQRTIERENGRPDEGFAQAARVIAAEYEYPTHSHASMGPACGIADVRADGVTIYTSTQKPHYAADGVADLLGIAREKVHAVWMFGTGSYGRNDQGDATADAAVLSQALGKPVRVQYMRDQALGWDPKGTAAVNRLRAGIDPNGKVVAYELISKGFSRENVATNEGRAAATLAGQLLGRPLEPKNTFNIPFASYTFDHNRVGWETIAPLMDRASPLRTTHLRDPYGPPILFGSESFMDEVAAALQMDPVEFRLTYLEHPRDLDAVRIAAEKAGWQRRASPRADIDRTADVVEGRGIAFRRHFDTFIALVAEVRVHRGTGRVEPLRYVCAHDCGLIVNPETLRHVIERQLVYATGRTTVEELRFDHEKVTSIDWLTYPVLHMEHVPPRIEIHLIDRPEAAPSGAAEMALGLAPAAIGNAVFDATGVRLRKVPFTPEAVKAALEKA
jgi:CO/xanthine dehydrogenase Mo-binding subunit